MMNSCARFVLSVTAAVSASFFSSFATIAAEAPRGQLLVFDENPFNGSPRGFYEYDFDSQQLTLVREIAELPGIRFEGMEWNPAKGLIYAGSNVRNLYTIDLGDGSINLVGAVPSLGFIRGIAFEPGTDQMYGFGFGPRLYAIDDQDASAMQVGLSPNLDAGLAFTPDGRLWGLNGSSHLIQLNPANGSTVMTAVLSGDRPLSDLAGSSDNRVFGVSWQYGGITEIDVQTGAHTVLTDFASHENGLMAVVFVPAIPEPCSYLLISILCGRIALGRSQFRRTLSK